MVKIGGNWNIQVDAEKTIDKRIMQKETLKESTNLEWTCNSKGVEGIH